MYIPILSSVERSAYIAAHRIVNDLWSCGGYVLTGTGESEYVFPGTRRSRAVDRVAALIVDSVEAGCETMGKVETVYERSLKNYEGQLGER